MGQTPGITCRGFPVRYLAYGFFRGAPEFLKDSDQGVLRCLEERKKSARGIEGRKLTTFAFRCSQLRDFVEGNSVHRDRHSNSFEWVLHTMLCTFENLITDEIRGEAMVHLHFGYEHNTQAAL